MRAMLLAYYDSMLAALGPSNWWPGETPFEVTLGAILTQNTAWTNVEKALVLLKTHSPLTPAHIWHLPVAELEQCIRPSGFFRLKAQRIRNFLTFLGSHERHSQPSDDASLACLAPVATARLRSELLGVTGIGPETADSILLYALDRNSFVVDTYTRRIMSRHGIVTLKSSYTDVQSLFMSNLPHDALLFNEYHALLVRVAKDFCHKSKTLCTVCPLNCFLTHGTA